MYYNGSSVYISRYKHGKEEYKCPCSEVVRQLIQRLQLSYIFVKYLMELDIFLIRYYTWQQFDLNTHVHARNRSL